MLTEMCFFTLTWNYNWFYGFIRRYIPNCTRDPRIYIIEKEYSILYFSTVKANEIFVLSSHFVRLLWIIQSAHLAVLHMFMVFQMYICRHLISLVFCSCLLTIKFNFCLFLVIILETALVERSYNVHCTCKCKPFTLRSLFIGMLNTVVRQFDMVVSGTCVLFNIMALLSQLSDMVVLMQTTEWTDTKLHILYCRITRFMLPDVLANYWTECVAVKCA